MRKKFLFITTTIAALAFTITGCYYDKEELVYPSAGGGNCDTTRTITYSGDVTGILSANCYACHSGTAGSGAGIKLDTYNGVKNFASSGSLLRAITHSPGASPMPKGGAKMPECNIAKIRTWIRNGAPNN